MTEHSDLSDPAHPARARRAIDAQLWMNAERAASAARGRRMETLFSGPMVAAPPAPVERQPWQLSPRVERRLHSLGDDRVSGDKPFTQHHSLDWLASWRITNWALNDRRPSMGVAILALVAAGLVAVAFLAVTTLVKPIAHEPPPAPVPSAGATPANQSCQGCATPEPAP